MKKSLKKLSFHKKIIIIFMVLLCVSSAIIGVTAYTIAKDSLHNKGEVILKNGVTQALMLIEAEYAHCAQGSISVEEAQENVKTLLLGTMNEDGTRTLHHNIDLGENGYFVIYDKEGNEIMHPTLEGENVWEVTDFSDEQIKLVQEQIDVGLQGGGFTYYTWNLPHSEEVGKKISYSNYNENWEWIVVSTAYVIDFNADAYMIFYVLILTIILIIIVSALIIISYVSEVAKPISMVVEGMSKVTNSEYNRIDMRDYGGEIDVLISGYNKMLDELSIAESGLLEYQDKLAYLAYHDELTSLSNRNGFKDYIDQRIEANVKTAYIVQLDIVGLKEINSTIGFEKGDEILQLIAEYFSVYGHDNCYASRTSSNEFCLWIEDIDVEELKSKIDKIRHDVKKFIFAKGFTQLIELYVAVASYPEEGLVFDPIYEKVTMAMKESKENKDFNINIYVDGMKKSIEKDLLIKKHLYKAIKNSEIIPYYQAKINYSTKEVVGVEALARWNSKELGIVPPNVFIPIIMKLNLMTEFTKYMIKHELNDYPRLVEKYNEDVSVSVNVPPSVFMEKGFYNTIKEMLSHSSINGNKLIIEITEDVFIADINRVNSIVDKLHGLGVSISIDDFGTGYSSLNYLINIDFDEMKIDKSFIDRVLEDEKVFKLFEILCKIAEVYDYHIVAEGVETNEQLEKIKSTSLKIIQGYLFSKPEKL